MKKIVSIKFSFKLGKTFTETFKLMNKEWVTIPTIRFQEERDDLEDYPKPQWPVAKKAR